jgi:hypothetical protein
MMNTRSLPSQQSLQSYEGNNKLVSPRTSEANEFSPSLLRWPRRCGDAICDGKWKDWTLEGPTLMHAGESLTDAFVCYMYTTVTAFLSMKRSRLCSCAEMRSFLSFQGDVAEPMRLRHIVKLLYVIVPLYRPCFILTMVVGYNLITSSQVKNLIYNIGTITHKHPEEEQPL